MHSPATLSRPTNLRPPWVVGLFDDRYREPAALGYGGCERRPWAPTVTWTLTRSNQQTFWARHVVAFDALTGRPTHSWDIEGTPLAGGDSIAVDLPLGTPR